MLDLRGNGGGLLDEAVLVASIFIPDGTIVTTRGRNAPEQVLPGDRRRDLDQDPAGRARRPRHRPRPRRSSPARCRTAGARKVVGTRTFGKGVFQEVKQLPNGGALDITVGEYFTPSGRNLGGGGVAEGAGIQPDVQAAATTPRRAATEALDVALRTLAAQKR